MPMSTPKYSQSIITGRYTYVIENFKGNLKAVNMVL